MKKIFSLIIIFYGVSTPLAACEICGCGNSSFQIGLLPNFNKGFVGYRFTAYQYNSQVRDEPSEFSHDRYRTMEIWGGMNFNRLQAMVFLPYVFSQKESDDGTTISNGLGDAMLLLNYKVLSTASLTNHEQSSIRHDLFVGGGIKLPTGLNQVDVDPTDFNIGDFNSQAGTGSVDYLITFTDNLMWNKSGLVTNVAYRFNGINHQEYQFGNRGYINASYYYTVSKSATKIKPNMGVNFQSNAINRFQGDEVEDSNGYIVNATVGLNVIRNRFGINAMGFLPVAQNMYDGQTKLRSGVLIGVTYSF